MCCIKWKVRILSFYFSGSCTSSLLGCYRRRRYLLLRQALKWSGTAISLELSGIMDSRCDLRSCACCCQALKELSPAISEVVLDFLFSKGSCWRWRLENEQLFDIFECKFNSKQLDPFYCALSIHGMKPKSFSDQITCLEINWFAFFLQFSKHQSIFKNFSKGFKLFVFKD